MNKPGLMRDFRDLLAINAFGNFRELLEAVTLHPVMGIYLSMIRNEKADPERRIRPDENYAREVLQLFSIGLHQLDDAGRPIPMGNPEPAYTQENVENFARVFTFTTTMPSVCCLGFKCLQDWMPAQSLNWPWIILPGILTLAPSSRAD